MESVEVEMALKDFWGECIHLVGFNAYTWFGLMKKLGKINYI